MFIEIIPPVLSVIFLSNRKKTEFESIAHGLKAMAINWISNGYQLPPALLVE